LQAQIVDLALSKDANRSKREKKPLHWMVKELFTMANEEGLNEQRLEEKILSKTGKRIPKNTLRYWKNGWSEPKIGEVELIAKTLQYELELMVIAS